LLLGLRNWIDPDGPGDHIAVSHCSECGFEVTDELGHFGRVHVAR